MFKLYTAVILSLSILSALATPVVVRDNSIRLPIAKHINATNIKDVLRYDQERAAALHKNAKPSGTTHAAAAPAINVPVTNKAVAYVASVKVGTDPNAFSLIVDSGSSNTWVGAGAALTSTSAKSTGQEVFVEYGSGLFIGDEVIDTVSLGPGDVTIANQSLGDAELALGFTGYDGILGIGPVDLTVGTLDPDSTASIPTVTDNLFSQGTIPLHEVSVSFEPATGTSVTNGELTFGGTDSTKYSGTITYTAITTTSPASEYWGIDQSITYGTANTEILSSTAGVVDTGTTLILIASDAYSRYMAATGATSDPATGLLTLTSTQYANLQDLNFHIGGTTFTLTPNAQIWPRSLNTAIGGSSGSIYLVIGSTGTPTGSGLDFIDGLTFLERFYSVFDTANKRVGLANTPFTTATSN